MIKKNNLGILSGHAVFLLGVEGNSGWRLWLCESIQRQSKQTHDARNGEIKRAPCFEEGEMEGEAECALQAHNKMVLHFQQRTKPKEILRMVLSDQLSHYPDLV